MNTRNTTLKLLLLPFVAVAMTLTAQAKEKGGNSESVTFDPGKTLYVQIIDQLPTLSEGGIYPESGEYSRFYYLKEAFEEVFTKDTLPMPVEYVRIAHDFPKDAQIVRVTAHFWELNRVGQYEFRCWATLLDGDAKEKLGVYTGKHSNLVGTQSTTWKLEQYNKAVSLAAEKILKEVKDRMAADTSAN